MAKKNISKSFFLMIRTTVLILLNGFLFYSCTKTETETLEEIDFYKSFLAGSGIGSELERVWLIDSLVVDGKGVPLTSYQLNYFQTYKSNGFYRDYDGYEGIWEMTSPVSLEIEITNTPNPKSLSYSIIELNPFQLHIEIISGSNKYLYYFTNQ